MATKALLILFLFFTGGYGLTINFQNYCSQPLWLATNRAPSSPDFEAMLKPGDQKNIQIFDFWTGTIWARTKCVIKDAGGYSCETGDCGSGHLSCLGKLPTSPAAATLLNFNLHRDVVVYHVSLIHGHNIAMRVEPKGGNLIGGGSCPVVDCARDISNVCPSYLVAHNKDGAYVGCHSPCDAQNKCCTQPCDDTKLFKNLCSSAVTHNTDGPIYKCIGANSYNVIFCPV